MHQVGIMLYTHLPYHNDSIIVKTDAHRKTHEERKQEDFFTNIFTSHFIARFRKGCSRVCMWEGAGDRTWTSYFDLHYLWPSRCVFLVLLDAQPEVLGSTAGCWLSLLHLISIFSGPQLIRGFRGPPRSGVAFPTTSCLYCLEVC